MKRANLIPVALSTMLLFWIALAGADDSKTIPRRIFIAAVEMPKHPDVVGSGAITAALLGGPIAAFAADTGNRDIESAYAQLLTKNNINVAADIAFEVMDQLSAKGYEVVGTAEQADATLKVYVQNYGLSAIKGSDGSIPVLTPVFVLTNRAGKKIWTKQQIWSLVREVPKTVQAHPVPDYFNDPKVLVREMRKVNAMVIAAALGKL